MTTPDPLDALKYMFVLTWTRLEGHEEHDLLALRDEVEHLFAPFRTRGPDGHLDEIRYSDGRPVSVYTDLGTETFETHFLPPGYPTAPNRC